MKKFLLATTALVAFAAGAQAADLGVPRSPVAAAVVAPAFNWTGFYVGGHLGYISTYSRSVELVSPAGYNGPGTAATITQGGAIGGLQAGYNYQINAFVAGIEADLSYRGSSASRLGFGSIDTFLQTRSGVQGSVRGRLGVAADRALLYVTGGLAFADFGSRVNDVNPVGLTITTNRLGLRAGWTLGAGVEYAVAPNWTVRGEYLYADFGTGRVSGISGLGTTSWSMRHNTHTVRLGVNYLFSTGPSAVVARY